ncbi:MAG: hypothetical protein DI539_10660 [Flavobacterium psychrophilum]|nr:MAG: hypothetical protein DI539_10660 [Flavobacterium psychrophilum]
MVLKNSQGAEMAKKEIKDIKISPKYYQSDWRALDLTKNNKNDWSKAIDIFKDRIEGRYLKQIEALDTNADKDIRFYSGFAIMSLTCLLIETLEQFWTGNPQTSRKSKTSIKKKLNLWNKIFKKDQSTISNDALAFYNFFQRSDKFRSFFDTHEKANVFYTKIRCGLLHQGQTKGKSLIHIRSSEPMLCWLNNSNIEEGVSINRREFVKEVGEVYKKYIETLEKSDLNFKRKTLEKKMKHIVDMK